MEWTELLTQILEGPLLERWNVLTAHIDSLYDVDRLWDKGFRDWRVEYKYRRGGKTLCTLYAKQGEARLLVTLGKAEREKFDAARAAFTPAMQRLCDETPILHDGQWLWIPLDENLALEDVARLLKIKRRPNRKQSL